MDQRFKASAFLSFRWLWSLLSCRCSRARGASPRPLGGFHLSLHYTENDEGSFPHNVLAPQSRSQALVALAENQEGGGTRPVGKSKPGPLSLSKRREDRLNSGSFKGFPAPAVRYDFNYPHWSPVRTVTVNTIAETQPQLAKTRKGLDIFDAHRIKGVCSP